jgi:pimeloyl-ACP methyl ester carboxylesterase
MPVAEINGVDLYYRVDGEGERLVLTHGAWTNSDTWLDLTERLRERFQVVAWDRRGHSRSHADPGSGDYSEDAGDLAALIEYLGGGPTHLVGNSSGGEIVLHLIASRPDLVASAAIHEPGFFGLLDDTDPHLAALVTEERAACDEVTNLIETGHNELAAETFIERVLGAGAWQMTPPELRVRMADNAPTFVAEAGQAFSPAVIDLETLSTAGIPLLVTLGTKSGELEQVTTRFVSDRLPGSRIEALEGVGHIPHRSHPDLYADVLLDFHDSVGAGLKGASA